jgi:hypothetical protein
MAIPPIFEAISLTLGMVWIMMAKWREGIDRVNQLSGTAFVVLMIGAFVYTNFKY